MMINQLILVQVKKISIKSLALKIKKIVGYDGKIIFNRKYPDGTQEKG